MTTRVSITSAAVAKISPRRRAVGRNEEGSAAVEFALTLPILLVVLLGIIELSMLTFANLMLDAGVRDAARYGLTGQQADQPAVRYNEIERLVRHRTAGLVTDLNFEIYTFPDGFGSIDMADLGSATQVTVQEQVNGDGDTVQTIENADGADQVVLYRAFGKYEMLTPVFPGFLNNDDSLTLEASFAFRNEPGEW
ncbi:MAG: hypothetical protein GVY13_14240 [Alphaproteobacteria bacterium]|nr:hypothetical protein [Alphaproteobacteria bacterium]